MGVNCNRCGRQIYAAWRTANGRHYHPHCFSCAICDTANITVSKLEAADLKEIYCAGCFDQYFNNDRTKLETENKEDISHHKQKKKYSSLPIEIIQEKNSNDVYENLDQYITPEESLNAIDLELSPHSSHARHATTKGKASRERTEQSFKDSIEEVIKYADSFSDRQKKVTNNNISLPVKREDSTCDIIQSTFSSRIPRLKSLLKIPSATMAIPNPKFEPVSRKHNQRPDFQRPRSLQQRYTDSKLSSSKMNDYLNSKRMRYSENAFKSKATIPMKAKHSVGAFAVSTKQPCFPRSISFREGIFQSGNISGLEESRISIPKEETGSAFKEISSTSFLKTPSPSFNVQQGSNTQIIQKPKDMMTNSSVRINKDPKVSNAANRIIPHVLPSCEQLLSIIMKPRNGNTIKNHLELENGFIGIETTGQKMKNPLECPICFDSLITNPNSDRAKSLENSVTECGHIFHRECINNWLIKTGNSRCPICSKLCIINSLIPVYLEANANADQNAKQNENVTGEPETLEALRLDYKALAAKYHALEKEHRDCVVKSAVSGSLRSAYEMECRNRVELQWENKRLQRKIEELTEVPRSSQGDSVLL